MILCAVAFARLWVKPWGCKDEQNRPYPWEADCLKETQWGEQATSLQCADPLDVFVSPGAVGTMGGASRELGGSIKGHFYDKRANLDENT